MYPDRLVLNLRAMREIGFVGLGVMGGPMAGHLLQSGASLTVWNRTSSKADGLRAAGAQVAEGLAQLADRAEIIFLCVSRTEDVRECLDAMGGASPGTLFVDHSTIEPAAAKAIGEQLRDRGHRFLDAPVTGGSAGAQSGQLTIFVGGEPDDFDEALPLLRAYAKRAERVGPSGSGQAMKMANQIAVAGALIGLCESLSFAEKCGLDIAQARELLAGGAAGSWAFEHYGPKVLARDWKPGFAIEHQVKDLVYCRETAQSIDAAVPCAQLVEELLTPMITDGRGGLTTAALFDRLKEMGYSE